MSEQTSILKMSKIIIQFIIFALPAYAFIQAQDVTLKDVSKTRPMFDGVNVEHIVNYTIDFDELCEFKGIYFKKNFTSPGRRVSEVKCLEYVWDSMFSEFEVDKEECIHNIIIGGRPAFFGEFPHMGALGWRSARNKNEWVFKCGATLISDKFMVTAAHCSYSARSDGEISSPTPEIVKIGDKFIFNNYPVEEEKSQYKDFNELILAYRTYRGQNIEKEMGPKYVPIRRIIKHNKYKAPKRYYDIALIELAESVTFGPLIRPACLWSSLDTSSLDKLSITGWGVVDPVTRKTSNELQVAEVNLVDDKICDESLKTIRNRNWNGLADHQICAGFLPGGVDTCQGDSGGPLQVKINLNRKWPMYYLVGVTSFGYGCARPDVPSVYVKTSSFVDWIENIVWPNA